MTGPAPLIVTLLLDDEAQGRFDRLRAAHFPARPLPGARREPASGGEEGVFRLQAHVTLFHALPGEHLADVSRELAEVADRAPFDVAVTGVRFLGRGVAIDLDAPELTALRRGLAGAFDPWLTRQDRQWSRPHVTVQNKVSPDVARALFAEMSASFVPETVTARGLGLWDYLGGPWSPAGEFSFR
ncbi:2'-5' RNA ligase family protein [Modestobacter muralis]|uniref:2'-5' RNA ligase family protein n=1 Tax=Modestobacter muralis TaxID=1608614 RepID=A0A6P0H893_9ACTN|nr:2'-5' RNA ligase family protein [Modestobacter muralis]NEN51932.1 2'-5' RNA ligase family protein [Modestobacter muralis]